MCARACVARRRRRRRRWRPAFSSLRGSFVLLRSLSLSFFHSSPPFLAWPLEGSSLSVSRSQPSSLCHCECESFRVRLRATDYRNQPVPVPVYRPTNYNHRFERRHFLVFELIREDASLLPRGSTGKRIRTENLSFPSPVANPTLRIVGTLRRQADRGMRNDTRDGTRTESYRGRRFLLRETRRVTRGEKNRMVRLE